MQLNEHLLLLISLIQAYQKYSIDLGILQESSGDCNADWYSLTNKYYYSLDEKYFKAAGIEQNECYFRQLLHFEITSEIDATNYAELRKWNFPDESENREKTVSSFFFYMWNSWSEQECEIVYGSDYKHFWDKWCYYVQNTSRGAAEKFYAELTGNNRAKLVTRADELYDRDRKRH